MVILYLPVFTDSKNVTGRQIQRKWSKSIFYNQTILARHWLVWHETTIGSWNWCLKIIIIKLYSFTRHWRWVWWKSFCGMHLLSMFKKPSYDNCSSILSISHLPNRITKKLFWLHHNNWLSKIYQRYSMMSSWGMSGNIFDRLSASIFNVVGSKHESSISKYNVNNLCRLLFMSVSPSRWFHSIFIRHSSFGSYLPKRSLISLTSNWGGT